ncbi:MAG: MFS transporter [Pseudomonadales bacterium]|nr:MFS transporter [Pseudomonadales bacterium]
MNPLAKVAAEQPDTSTFASLKIADYRYLWIGMVTSAFAMNMQLIAQGWLVYEMTSSSLDLSYVTLAFMLPQVILSPIGGVLADRIKKKPIIGWSPFANGIATLLMTYVIMTDQVTFGFFILIAAFNGSIMALSIPARTALIPAIVNEQLIFNAMAFNTASWNLSRIVGPSLAGFMIAIFAAGDTSSTFGVGMVYLLLSVLYFVSALTVLLIKESGDPTGDGTSTPVDDLVEGLQYAVRSPVVGGLILLSIYPFLFGLSINTFLPAFNTDVLKGGADDLGFLMTSMGVGAILGSLLLARFASAPHKGYWVIGSSALWGLTLALFAVTETYIYVVIFIGLIGFWSAVNMSMNRSLMQLQVAPGMRGRIMSIDMMAHGLMPLGILPIGYIAEHYSVEAGLATSGLVLFFITVVSAIFMPKIRAIDSGYTSEDSSEIR